jgi:AraC-like DNA-binding protein
LIDTAREAIRVIFAVLCLMDIRHAHLQIRDRYSSIEKIDFTWLSFLVIAFLVLRIWVLFVVLIAFIGPGMGSSFFNRLGLIGNYGTFAMISYLIFFSLTRSRLFTEDEQEKPNQQPEIREYTVDPQLTKKIEQHMQTEKPYLHHFLNLEQLATQLEMHPRALSVTIKQHFDTNFYEFVNSYRIDEAKQMLANPELQDKTMIDILGECGFNSKATYNTFFKKLVGCTPTQFRAKHLTRTD